MRIKVICLCSIILFATTPQMAADKITIAVMDFKADGVSKRIASTVSEMVRTEMINIGYFTIIERTQMDVILKEQGFQQTGCTDQDCSVKLGKLLSARKAIIGSVSTMGKSIIINGRMIDVEKGIAEFGHTESAESEDALYSAVKRFTKKLSDRIQGKIPPEEEAEVKVVKTAEPENKKTIGGIEFVYIKGGEYMMGSDSPDIGCLFKESCGQNEMPRHKVKVDGFYLGKYEVTQKQYRDIMGENPAKDYGVGDNYPVYKVSWKDAQKFCDRFSAKYGVKSRLPYEAEWEYACRAGTGTAYYWGNEFDGRYGWGNNNSNNSTHPVGEKKPNAWGLYDMSGNVDEWCMDWYDENYYKNSPSDNPKGPGSSPDGSHVMRGGSITFNVSDLRSKERFGSNPYFPLLIFGFRLAVSVR